MVESARKKRSMFIVVGAINALVGVLGLFSGNRSQFLVFLPLSAVWFALAARESSAGSKKDASEG